MKTAQAAIPLLLHHSDVAHTMSHHELLIQRLLHSARVHRMHRRLLVRTPGVQNGRAALGDGLWRLLNCQHMAPFRRLPARHTPCAHAYLRHPHAPYDLCTGRAARRYVKRVFPAAHIVRLCILCIPANLSDLDIIPLERAPSPPSRRPKLQGQRAACTMHERQVARRCGWREATSRHPAREFHSFRPVALDRDWPAGPREAGFALSGHLGLDDAPKINCAGADHQLAVEARGERPSRLDAALGACWGAAVRAAVLVAAMKAAARLGAAALWGAAL